MRKSQWLFVVLVIGVISFSLDGLGIAGDRTCPLPIRSSVAER